MTEQRVYNGRLVLMEGPNVEDWWIADAMMEAKPSGFAKRGGGASYGNAWNTGFDYLRITMNVATLTQAKIEDLLGIPLAANSHQMRYQDEVVPVTPFTIALDENANNASWITVFGHSGDGAWSKMTPGTAPLADDNKYLISLTPPSSLTFHTGAEGEQVRIRYTVDSTAGKSALLDPDYLPTEVDGVFFTSEYVEGDAAGTHGEMWEIPAMIMTADSSLKWGGDAQGGEGQASTIVYQIQGTNLPTYNRW